MPPFYAICTEIRPQKTMFRVFGEFDRAATLLIRH